MRVVIHSLASGLHAEAAVQTARESFIRDIVSAMREADPSVRMVVAGELRGGVVCPCCGADTPAARFRTPLTGPDATLNLIYVRTGGTEGAFKAAFTGPDGSLCLPDQPIRLLTSGKSNSLAASMEILSFLRLHGHEGEILHGSVSYIVSRMLELAYGLVPGGSGRSGFAPDSAKKVPDGSKKGVDAPMPVTGRRPFDAAAWKTRLAGKRLGVVGKPSDWLISSDVDPAVARETLGLELLDIPMEELVAEIRRGGYEQPDGIRWPSMRWPVEPAMKGSPSSPVESLSSPARPGISGSPITRPFNPRFGRELTPEAFGGAMDIYGALCRLVARYRLDGLTLRCFDLLTEVGNTGCMALAILNAQGIPASCEGDVPALISMLVAHELCGCCGFQANPARIDPQSGEMLLAHCTVPLDMIRGGEYDTHFESGIGVAVRGELPEGPVTVFKLAPDLRQCFAVDAELVRNQAERDLCRTQVVLRAPGTARYFLTDSIGNHHIIVPGHHASFL